VAGVATFSDITIDLAGTDFTLSATSGALSAATSAVFVITVPPAGLGETTARADLATSRLVRASTLGVSSSRDPVRIVHASASTRTPRADLGPRPSA
jgi:hypothetical protein